MINEHINSCCFLCNLKNNLQSDSPAVHREMEFTVHGRRYCCAPGGWLHSPFDGIQASINHAFKFDNSKHVFNGTTYLPAMEDWRRPGGDVSFEQGLFFHGIWFTGWPNFLRQWHIWWDCGIVAYGQPHGLRHLIHKEQGRHSGHRHKSEPAFYIRDNGIKHIKLR